MTGTSLAVGVLAVTATLALGYGAAGVAAVRSAQLSGAADAAALAAADAAAGALPGVPCEHAAVLAATVEATLARCELDEHTATVEVTASIGVFLARARARAGPPG